MADHSSAWSESLRQFPPPIPWWTSGLFSPSIVKRANSMSSQPPSETKCEGPRTHVGQPRLFLASADHLSAAGHSQGGGEGVGALAEADCAPGRDTSIAAVSASVLKPLGMISAVQAGSADTISANAPRIHAARIVSVVMLIPPNWFVEGPHKEGPRRAGLVSGRPSAAGPCRRA